MEILIPKQRKKYRLRQFHFVRLPKQHNSLHHIAATVTITTLSPFHQETANVGMDLTFTNTTIIQTAPLTSAVKWDPDDPQPITFSCSLNDVIIRDTVRMTYDIYSVSDKT